jgi:hypothetical protein
VWHHSLQDHNLYIFGCVVAAAAAAATVVVVVVSGSSCNQTQNLLNINLV